MRLILLFALLFSSFAAVAMSRDEAAARAQQQTGGRVLAVEEVQQGGQTVYRVKVLTPSGDVRIVVIPAGR